MSRSPNLAIRINNYISNSDSPLDSPCSFDSPVNIRRIERESYFYDVESSISYSNENLCNICQEEIKDLIILRCSHTLCLQCFLNWFKTNKKCPYCREDIDIEIFLADDFITNERLTQYVRYLFSENNRLQIENSENSGHDFSHCICLLPILCSISLFGALFYFTN